MANWVRPQWRSAPALVATTEEKHGGCPICGSSDHNHCKFQAGSLYCVTHDCANPHHRSRA